MYQTQTVAINLPHKLKPLFTQKARYKIAYGGRGGAKSWSFARMLLLLGLNNRLRIMCAREFQVSISDSVHRLLSDQIKELGLLDLYSVQRNVIIGRNGTLFFFVGLRNNINNIKSAEGVDYCWVEEAEKVSKNSWETLIPTIRKANSEIWISFNPDLEDDPTYLRFIVNPPPDTLIIRIGWQDNPWLSKELLAEKDYLYKVDPLAAAHVWGGEPRTTSDLQVLRGRYRIEPFAIEKYWDGPYFGADWGFSVDPTVLVKCWVDVKSRALYVEYEAYGIGVEIDQTPALFRTIPNSQSYTIRADSSRPETIAYMQRHTYPRLIRAHKWNGSVEDGVEFLRSFQMIVIHPRCKHTAEEARLWCYKTNRGGDPLPILEDKHNHCWDAIRYSLEPIIKKSYDGPLTMNVPKL